MMLMIKLKALLGIIDLIFVFYGFGHMSTSVANEKGRHKFQTNEWLELLLIFVFFTT